VATKLRENEHKQDTQTSTKVLLTKQAEKKWHWANLWLSWLKENSDAGKLLSHQILIWWLVTTGLGRETDELLF